MPRTRGYCLEGNNVTTTPLGFYYRKKNLGPTEIRTRVTTFKESCANHYTMGPYLSFFISFVCLEILK